MKPNKKIFSVLSNSPEETKEIAFITAGFLSPKTSVALRGGLGAGKTCFCQGLAEGLDIPAEIAITSPTYTLMNIYPGNSDFYHGDFYRLSKTSEIEETGFYDFLDSEGILALEWPENADLEWFDFDISVSFKIKNENTRIINFSAGGQKGLNMLMALTRSKRMAVYIKTQD